jgi:nitroreductase
MELSEALTTTGAVRDYSAVPVPDQVVYLILEAARFAPSGGNRQGWHVVLVKDRAIKGRLRDLYLTGWYEYLAMGRAGLVPWAPVTDRAAEAEALEAAPDLAAEARGSAGFAENLDQVPVLLAVLADLRRLAAVDRDHGRYSLVGGASIYPFAWSILLAARAKGLGGVITTMLVREETAAGDLLGVPKGWALAGVIALGYPAGQRATRLRRAAPEAFTTVDRFDGPALARPSATM